MTEYRFKPALLRSAQAYRLNGPDLAYADGWELDLRQVTAISYSETTVGVTTSRLLQLRAGGQMHQIAQTIDTRGPQDMRADYTTLVIAILRGLHALQPEIHVSYGLHGQARMGMFVVGALSLLAGLALPIAALATGVSDTRLLAAAVPAGLLVLLGLGFGWPNRPWQAPPQVPLAALIDRLDALSDSPVPPGG